MLDHVTPRRNRNDISVEVEVGVTESNKKTIAKDLRLTIESNQYLFKFEKGNSGTGKCSLLINDIEEINSDVLSFVNVNQFLPVIGTFVKSERQVGGEKVSRQMFEEEFIEQNFNNKLKKLLKRYFHHNTSETTIQKGLNRIGVIERSEVKNRLQTIFKTNSTFMNNLSLHEKEICDLVYNYSMHAGLTDILRTLNMEIGFIFKSVRYIAPLRATAERYYRHQDLQIEEIDHTGSNLAMLLRSFSPSENEKFSSWTLENFGFKVRVEELGLHYALKIQTDKDSKEYNINDMGFGFSQILPIVASIWMEIEGGALNRRYRNADNRPLIFAIEQPELHLHPEYQSRLARMFASVVNTAKANNIDLKILFETHSKTMIDT
ncbi:hypothetical protein A3743_21015, partial [Oleiphilus sp. HI0072]